MTGETPNPLDQIRRAIRKKFNDPGEASTILAEAALARVADLVEAAQALLEWAEKDRGGGYPEANRSEEWYTHRDFARKALVPFAARENTND